MPPEVLKIIEGANEFGVAILALWVVLAVIKFMVGVTKDHNQHSKEWRQEFRESRQAYQELVKDNTTVISELKQVIIDANIQKEK